MGGNWGGQPFRLGPEMPKENVAPGRKALTGLKRKNEALRRTKKSL